MSIHFRSRDGIDTADNVKFDVCRGLAFATSFPVFFSPTLVTGISSNVSVTCVFDNKPSHPVLDRSSCFRGSILSLEMFDHFEADMILSVCQVDRHQASCLFSTVFARPASEQSLINRAWLWKICKSLLLFAQQVSLCSCISLRSLICCRHFSWHLVSLNCFEQQVSLYFLTNQRYCGLILHTCPQLLR